MAVLPKSMKNHALLKGYRIITMANVWVKMCEKVAASRLSETLEQDGHLPNEVGGARPGRSTTANIETVTHLMAQSLQRGKCCAIATYDLEDAYNKVDISVLANKLEALDIPKHMVRWIVALLGTRKCQMQYGKWKSELFEVSSGLPQGSPLSPVLFNVYTCDIISSVKTEGTHPSTDVDDIIVVTTGDTAAEVTSMQQTASDKLHTWTVVNKQSIQGEKSQWMIVTLARVNRSEYHLMFSGDIVPQGDLVVCLGVANDHRLTMSKHLERLRT